MTETAWLILAHKQHMERRKTAESDARMIEVYKQVVAF